MGKRLGPWFSKVFYDLELRHKLKIYYFGIIGDSNNIQVFNILSCHYKYSLSTFIIRKRGRFWLAYSSITSCTLSVVTGLYSDFTGCSKCNTARRLSWYFLNIQNWCKGFCIADEKERLSPLLKFKKKCAVKITVLE